MDDEVAPWDETVAVLRKRRAFLERLADDGARKPVLVEDLDCSRSTVDRAIEELLDEGLVTRTANGYRTTLLGRSLLSVHEEFLETARELVEARDVFEATGDTEFLSPALLTGSDVHSVDPMAPFDVYGRVESLLDDGTTVRAAMAAFDTPRQFHILHRKVLDGASLDLLVAPELLERLCDSFAPELIEMAREGSFRLFAGECRQSCLRVVDDEGAPTVAVIVRGADRRPLGLVLNDTPEAVAHASGLLDSCFADAVDVTRGLTEPDASPEEVCRVEYLS